MVIIVDNYDSFTYNLVQYLGELGEEVKVFRNDKILPEEIEALIPSALIISPGPGRPSDAGISKRAIEYFAHKIPILGVCLGHQAIAEVYGAVVERGDKIMHGKVSSVYHEGDRIFKDVPSPFIATRYHSLVVRPDSVVPPIEVTAWTEDNEIMALKHTDLPTWGVQFHPESILTVEGKKILRNFLKEKI
ncbi:MAG: aminodeoxychorismate/anthranilate synthase component II [Candidatus Omnitrophota bacterium]